MARVDLAEELRLHAAVAEQLAPVQLGAELGRPIPDSGLRSARLHARIESGGLGQRGYSHRLIGGYLIRDAVFGERAHRVCKMDVEKRLEEFVVDGVGR